MANHVSHGSLPYPIKNARYTLLVPYLDADGDPTDPTTPDTELSGDGGAFADCAEEVSTITGSNGMGYLTLSGAEMNYSLVALAAKVASGPKATLATLYPRNLPVLASGTLSAGSAGGGTLGTLLEYDLTNCFIRTTGGTGGGGTGGANNQARRIATYDKTTGAFTVTPNWETTPNNTTTYDILLPEGMTVGMVKALNADVPEVVAANGAVQANMVQVGGLSTLVGIWLSTFLRGSISSATLNTVTVSALINGNDADLTTKLDTSFKDFMLMAVDSDNIQVRQVVGWNTTTNTFTVSPDFDDTPLTEECYLYPAPAIPLLFDKTLAYAQLLARNDADIATDRVIELAEINADEGSGAGTYDNTGESLQAHANSLASYVASLAGLINDLIYSSTILETTVSAATSNTVFELTGGSTSDDVYNDHFVVIQQVGTPANRMVGKISAYAGATKEITLQADPGLFTISIGDSVYILSEQVSAGGGLDAAGVRAAVGLASANLDDQLTALTAPFMKMYVWSTVDTATTGVVVLDAPLVNLDGTVTPDFTSFVGWYLVITNLTDYWQARPVATFDGATEFEVMSEYSDTPPTGAYGILFPPGFDMQSARDAMTLAISSFAAGAVTGSVDDKLNDLQTDVTSIQADTNDIQTRLPAALVSGRMDSNVQAMADDVITAAKIAADAIGASEIAAGAFDADAFTTALAEKIADVILRRQMDNVEGSSNGDALDKSSLYGLVQQAQEANTEDNPGELTIYKTNGTTELGRLTLATDAAADPVTGTS